MQKGVLRYHQLDIQHLLLLLSPPLPFPTPGVRHCLSPIIFGFKISLERSCIGLIGTTIAHAVSDLE